MEQKNDQDVGREEQVPDFGLDRDSIRECEPSLLLPHAMKLANSTLSAKAKPVVETEEGPGGDQAIDSCEVETPVKMPEQESALQDPVVSGERRSRFPLRFRLAAAACALICLYAGWEIVQESMATAGSHKESASVQELLPQPDAIAQQPISSVVGRQLVMAPVSSASAPVAKVTDVAVKQEKVAAPQFAKAVKKSGSRKVYGSKPKLAKTTVAPAGDADVVLAVLQKAREAK